MKYTYDIDTSLNELADEVLQEKKDLQHLTDNGARICYIVSSKPKKQNGELVLADTRLVKGVWTAFCPYDFVITFYAHNIQHLDIEQMHILMWHELKHCGINQKGEFYIIPHDIQDFSEILEKHGLYWAE